jgi:hypothetical protein
MRTVLHAHRCADLNEALLQALPFKIPVADAKLVQLYPNVFELSASKGVISRSDWSINASPHRVLGDDQDGPHSSAIIVGRRTVVACAHSLGLKVRGIPKPRLTTHIWRTIGFSNRSQETSGANSLLIIVFLLSCSNLTWTTIGHYLSVLMT